MIAPAIGPRQRRVTSRVAERRHCRGLTGLERQAILAASMRRDSRRQFLQCSLALVGISLLSGRESPSPSKVPRIGFLAVGSREGRGFLIEGFLQGLRELGYVEGQNIVIEYRFSEDRDDRLPELAAQLVDLKVKLILASGTPASFAAKQATSTIPIVMGGLAANPVETGLVANLARKYRVPTMTDTKEFLEAGSLISLGPSLVDSYRRSATHVDKILKGAKPADLPMEQPTKFDLLVNLKTAQALGLTIPQSVLVQATQVIQ